MTTVTRGVSCTLREYLRLDAVATKQVTDVTFRKIVGNGARAASAKCIPRRHSRCLPLFFCAKNQTERNGSLALTQHADFEKYNGAMYAPDYF